ncbi:unnamed protein product [Lepidochelys olivacea]
MAGTAPTAAALPPAAASRPAAPSTSPAGAPPPAPRAYAQVAAAPPPTATSSLPPATSATSYSGRGPFPNMTRKHGVRCLLVPASPHVETYVRALARVVGPTAIAAASKMYGKVVFFLASEAAAQEAVEKGLAVGGVFVPLEPLDDLGVRLVLTSVPPFLPNAALLPALSTLGKPISVLSPLPLGCKDPALRHVLSFRRQVQLQLPPAARDGEALEGSFLIPYQGAHYRVHYSTGEARCYLCRAMGHVRRDCSLARHGEASGTPEPRQGAGPVIAGAPGCPAPEAAPPPTQPTTAPARARGALPPARPDERESPASATCALAEPPEEGAAGMPPSVGEGPPQGDSSLPSSAPPPPPTVPEPSSLPPDPTPGSRPPDEAMEGWALVRGKQGKRKARAPPPSTDAEAPRKTRKGGADAEPSVLPAGAHHPLVPAGDNVVARKGSTIPPLGTLPSTDPDGAPPAPLPLTTPVSLGASVASGTSGEASGVAAGELPSIYEEIEALGLTPVTQGEDDPLLAGLDLSDLAPTPPVPCPLPLPVTFATASEGPQGSSICPAVSGTLRLDAEPTEATAGAFWLGPEPHGLPLEDVGRLTSFPGGDPTAGAVAPLPVVVPEPDILEGPLPHPHLPEPDREGPFSTGLAPGAQAPALAPLPGSVPNPCLALPRDPCPAPDVNPAPAPPTSRAVTAAPGAVISSPHEDSPRGAAPVFPSPDSLGAAILPPPPPLQPGVEEGCVAPVHQAPRRGSAPCLPVSAGHGAVSAVPPEDSRGLVAPAPHALREELREFLEDVRGSRNKVQLALQRWGDFHLILRAARALMGEGKRTGKQAATAYQRVRLFRDSLMTYGETHTDPAAEASWRLEWGDRVYFSHLTIRTAGVATLFSPDLQPEVLGVAEAVPGRLLHLRVRLEGLVVNLVNIYAPTSGPERLRFFQRASAFLGTLDPHECLVLGGDFNTTLEERDRSGTEQCPAAADVLREIVDHHSLVDVWRDHHPDDTSTFTFVRVEARRARHSRLDRIYLSRFHLSQAHSSSIRPAPFSDHHLATVTVSLCAEKPGPAYWHFNNSLLEDVGFVASFREFWLAWRGQRRAFPSARRWWNLGKVRARLFCRDYTRGASRRRDAP